ncbi:efflux RND transporter periplasmic adaptor subunit [Rubritalea marina]|uniref:efflux RND transporter periplasmic adaptor subunit n=1 Tax=Rubritalea marina TaxID=361055 RepID=UPI000A04AAEC|nr:efflux RND transporter periplasmic adaptor subunit [Rubritalea marina]
MKRFLIMLAVFAAGLFVWKLLVSNPVRVAAVEKVAVYPAVTVHPAELGVTQLKVLAHGQIEPVTQTMLVSEVGGALIEVSENLKVGGVFRKGESMLRIEPIRYEQALEQAELNVAEAELRVIQEITKSAQAKRDWGKLGRKGEPSELSMRVPQVKAAEAFLEASEVALKQAQYDLTTAELKAPYDCMVVESSVDDGGYVTRGSQVAKIYSIENRQVRLPVKLEYFSFLSEALIGNEVELVADVSGGEHRWLGKVARYEQLVDRSTHSMMLVVELEKEPNADLPPFGLYVDTMLDLGSLEDVVELPATGLRANDSVFVVGEGNRLEVLEVELAHRQDGKVYVRAEGLDGAQVIVSPMEYAVAGMQVEVTQANGKVTE